MTWDYIWELYQKYMLLSLKEISLLGTGSIIEVVKTGILGMWNSLPQYVLMTTDRLKRRKFMEGRSSIGC